MREVGNGERGIKRREQVEMRRKEMRRRAERKIATVFGSVVY